MRNNWYPNILKKLETIVNSRQFLRQFRYELIQVITNGTVSRLPRVVSRKLIYGNTFMIKT